MNLRAHLITALAGVIAPFLLVEVVTLATIYLWLPASRYLWTAHGIAVRTLLIDTAAALDGLLSACLGFAIAIGVTHISRYRPISQWLLFAASFLLALSLPTLFDREYEALVWFLTRPFIAIFLAFAAVGFWLASRRQIAKHVA
jgi:hypothetical protein